MKALKTQLRPIILLLALIMFFQSCTIYKSTPVTLHQAEQSDSKVQVMTNTSEKLEFKRIGVENGNYYGVKKVNGEIIKAPLNEKYISSIKEKDKAFSTIATAVVSIVSLFGILLIAYSTDGSGSGWY